jgi:hypothetical protein
LQLEKALTAWTLEELITWKQHFALVAETTEEYGIIPENDYGYDESPLMLGIAAKHRVVGRRQNASGKRVRQSFERRDGNTLTVAEFICGRAPTIFFLYTIYSFFTHTLSL